LFQEHPAKSSRRRAPDDLVRAIATATEMLVAGDEAAVEGAQLQSPLSLGAHQVPFVVPVIGGGGTGGKHKNPLQAYNSRADPHLQAFYSTRKSKS
jgi:hypothetical protein